MCIMCIALSINPLSNQAYSYYFFVFSGISFILTGLLNLIDFKCNYPGLLLTYQLIKT